MFACSLTKSLRYLVSIVEHGYYSLNYYADAHGYIDGVTAQAIEAHGSGTAVVAIAESGYMFSSWSDGVTTATRQDHDVQTDLSVAAYFSVISNPASDFMYLIANQEVTIVSYIGSAQSVRLPETIEGFPVTAIGSKAFKDKDVVSVSIPDSVTSIGGNAFSGCSGLTSITIPDSVTSIGSGAFHNTAWYEAQPDGLVYAGKVAYAYKGEMPTNTSITLLAGTKGIADYAFYGCSGLTSITIPAGVASIGNYAFQNCSGITSITLSAGVTSIGDYAFYNCRGLTSITIPASVTSIGDAAFYSCSGLTSITIPDSVTSIGHMRTLRRRVGNFGGQGGGDGERIGKRQIARRGF
jgi:hypothetical protein